MGEYAEVQHVRLQVCSSGTGVELSLTHGCGAECRLFSHCLVCVSNRNIFGACGIRPTLIGSWSRT